MTVKSDLIELVVSAATVVDVPPISDIYLPEPDPGPDKETEFGIVVLEDGSAGLYYAWLGDTQQGMNSRYAVQDYIGRSPLSLLPLFDSEHEADCSFGMAAINAISQCVFRHAGFHLETAPDSLGSLPAGPGDHVGMVGYFPSLARSLRDRGARVTVIEKKDHFIGTDTSINITRDPECLTECNRIISTASTLLNNSIDDLLQYMGNAEQIVIIGPTAGFLPDPLFSRGITVVGGSEIVDPASAIIRLQNKQGLKDTARKYVLHKERYPGADTLLRKARKLD